MKNTTFLFVLLFLFSCASTETQLEYRPHNEKIIVCVTPYPFMKELLVEPFEYKAQYNIYVSNNGKVDRVDVVSSNIAKELHELVLSKIYMWTYVPVIKSGEKYPFYTNIEISLDFDGRFLREKSCLSEERFIKINE